MPSRYHPIEDGLWNDDRLEGTPFEEKGFFAFLCSNCRQRPSGIYRVTDAQLSADTELPEKRVKGYVSDLATRGRIVRDGAWMFVRNYLKRQPKQERLLNGVQSDITNCDSVLILEAFSEQYPLFSRWSTDRLKTVTRPMNGFVSTEQYQLQSSTTTTTTTTTTPERTPPGVDPVASWGTPEALVKLYNESTPDEFAACTALTPERRKKAEAILRILPEQDFWVEVFKRCHTAPFLRGQVTPTNGHRRFHATFDWFLARDPQKQTENAVKVREGFYHGTR